MIHKSRIRDVEHEKETVVKEMYDLGFGHLLDSGDYLSIFQQFIRSTKELK